MCEEEIKKVTPSVLKYILPDTCSEERKKANPITAEEIVEAIKDGKDVEIKNAVITGPFILKSVNVEGEITIQNTKIRGPIDWSYATFKRVMNLKKSIFETETETDATFTAVTVEKDIFLDGATFCGKAVFANITVMGTFYSQSTTFEKDVIFSDGTFKKRIIFSKSTFVGEANFGRARIGGVANFTGAEFKERANFNSAQIDGHASFKPANLFNIEVEFKDDLSKGIISEKLKNIFETEDYSLSENAIVTKEKDDKWRITDREKIYIVKKEEGKLNIYNPATFVGEADFESARIGSNAEFPGVKFGGDTDFGSARIGGTAEFPGAEFKQLATFNRAQIEESAFFNQATFWSEANFVSARIGSNAEFQGAEFKQLATFNSAQIEGAAFFNHAYLFIIEVEFKDDLNKGSISEKLKNIFETEDYSLSENAIVTKEKDDKWRITDREKIYIVKKEEGKLNIYNPTTFVDEADFGSARIGGTAEFQEASFKERAIFNGAQIGGVFFDPATFEDEANFVSARIGSNAEFQGAEFKQLATFNRAQIEESAFFNQATFWGEANFVSARIGSNAVFNGAVFKGGASFNSVERLFKRFPLLSTRAKPKGRASFKRAQIDGDALFKSAIFEDEADFVSARIGSTAVFTRAEFKQQAIFNSAQIERESHFEGTVFANDVSFQDTSFKTVFFGEPNVQFIKNIDLRGCTYDRIQPIPFWKQLMEHLDPYDRQPFTHLEETFRRAGKDKLADDVYYERKCRESAQKTIRKPGAWLLDRFLFGFTGYGVRLNHLLWAIVPILLIGIVIFHLEGAVTPEQLPSMMSFQVTLPWSEAFWVSLNTFLPVEIPSGADWEPSSQIIPVLGIKFTTFATLLNLAGWILVPVGVAGIAGLLKRPK